MVEEKECCNYKCILMDLNMPIMDGFAATKILRERIRLEQLDPVDIIGVTANSQNEVIAKCLKGGFTLTLEKPIFLEALKEALEKYFEKDYFKKKD